MGRGGTNRWRAIPGAADGRIAELTATSSQAMRFELRVWGADLDEVAARAAQDSRSHRRQTLCDLYLVMSDPDLCVKVRGGQLKVKRVLLRPAGLTGWSAPRRRRLGCDRAPGPSDRPEEHIWSAPWWPPDAALGSCTFVSLAKDRRLFRMAGTVVETTTLSIAGGPTLRTAAVEGGEVEAVLTVSRRLGLDPGANQPVHAAVRRLLGNGASPHPARPESGLRPR